MDLKENIKVGKYAGFCYGVRRAVEMAESKAKEHQPVYTAGPIIHNKFVIEDQKTRGIIPCESASDVPNGSAVLIRAHGITKEDEELLREKGCTIYDATCPNVLKIHRIVENESMNGRIVIIVGSKIHPEVLGIKSRAKVGFVAENEEELRELLEKYSDSPVSVVAQTTLNKKLFVNFQKNLKNCFTNANFFDTICMATSDRQNEVREYADKYGSVVIIGDKASSNSRKLYEIASEYSDNVQFIENSKGLDITKIDPEKGVFLTAGASTPDLIIKEVNRKMENRIVAKEENFAELLEKSLKTLHTGDKVTGTVTQIKPTDIHVDLGVKQDGYIPMSELSDDPTFNVEENIKIGMEIECFVVRVNDVEGTIMLSKKRLDSQKNWEVVEKACEEKTPVEGVIVDQNKGGVVASVLGVRVFIPASQTGLAKDAAFDSMMKTKHQILITEVNRAKRRVVGSIRALQVNARKEAEAKVWAEIAVGNQYEGTVKSFTSYGAFVDIGGVDGMVHISELSWNHIKHPSEVLTIGQKVNVFVIALDTEKKKISLGYRLASENPWTKFVEKYAAGDVANVEIVKFMPFGAFAEVMPGVDGLIHISQIADKRIGKPEEVLKIGQKIDAKITEIDMENKKISLSIRALLEAVEAPAEEVADAE